MRKTSFLILCFILSLTIGAQPKIKVSCVGNSVTFGAALPNREVNAYPFQLQRMLGDKYEVANFGKNGATLLNKGHRPYMQQEEYKQALAFAGDYVIIHLGLNDTDPHNWPNYQDDFVKDYLSLIDSFRKANPLCKVFICRMTPITDRHPRFRSGTRDWHEQIQKTIENIAAHADVQLIDFEAPLFNHPNLLPDAIHPNVEGANLLARTVYSALTGNYGGLQMPILYTDRMVLQRNKELVINGTADAGEQVTVQLNKQKHKTVTGVDGKWNVTLNAMQAGGPYTLKIATPKKKLTYKEVMIGEVWLCSGQSNMVFMVKESVTAEADKLNGNQPHIRLFNMQSRWISAKEWDASVLDSLNKLQYYKDTKWTNCTPTTLPDFSAVAYHFGKRLADSLQVTVGLICNAVGGSPAESWIDRRTLNKDFPDILVDWTRNDFVQDWVRGRAMLNTKRSTDKLQRHPYEPCYLYESGIIPLAQYPIKGVVWYQGESNAHNIEVHEMLFPMLVDSWRRNWKEAELPFYYVQLSSLSRPSWPLFRDSQRRLLNKITHTGMVVSSDKGDSLDVHPKQKQEIGERLAAWALNKTYDYKKVVASGPLFKGVRFIAGAAMISFDYGEGMHTSDNAPIRSFEVAGDNLLFYPAQAIVIEKTIKVWSNEVKNPKIVRYGWQPFTQANLVNEANLPASTFRSEY
ncbi:MAG: GDSL-type esterase/lipase family protein [Bacteroidaceae bacterium]